MGKQMADCCVGVDDGGKNAGEELPEEVYGEVFRRIPAREVAGACSLVCKAWRGVAGEAGMWRERCEGAGLSAVDCSRGGVLAGTWKGLYGKVFGQNMVACPHFEPVDHMEMEAMKKQTLGPWEPKHRLLINRVSSLDEHHDDTHTYSFWAVEGGTVFQRGGGDGVVRESPPLGCPPCPSSPRSPVLATSYDWGKLQQCISFPTFSKKFLDSSPPLLLSAWIAGVSGVPSKVKLQLLLRDDLKNGIYFWDSGEIHTPSGEWQEVKAIIKGYPAGMRSLVLKIGGMSVGAKKKHGFYGAKFTGLKLSFIPPLEVNFFDESVVKLGKATTCYA